MQPSGKPGSLSGHTLPVRGGRQLSLIHILDTLEAVLAYAADRLMESLAAGGVYNPDNIWKKPIEQSFDDLMNNDIIDIAVNGLDTTFNSLLAGAVGSFGGVAYEIV